MKIKIIAKTDAGKFALERALWVKEHPEESLKLLTKFKERFMFRAVLKEYELKILEVKPFTVEYDVLKASQLMAKDTKVRNNVDKMMSDYGAEPTDYEVKV